ncbi:glycoside hydrolase family 57 protein [Patescibacteria group bacterium]|nr:glycoside hydrolase family 57 protein [Patescibacteria group bacterium]
MPQVCFYFQLHQPYRLKQLNVFDLEKNSDYFTKDNRQIFLKVAEKSYRPMLTLLLGLTQAQPKFSFALSCSGVFLEQAEKFSPDIIELLKKLAQTKQVEFLAETYYHSLASLYSDQEFFDQVKLHGQKIKKLFNLNPRIFRNSELIYSNQIAELVAKLGYKGILTEAVDRYLGGRDKTKVYLSYTGKPIPVMLKHAQLSDDIAFRFSNRQWEEYPLTVEKYLRWVEIYSEKQVVNLFMDFETFGEHQWADTGIFDFFTAFVHQFLAKPYNYFVTPSEAISGLKKSELEVYDVPVPISWADIDRDLTAWVDNSLQQDSIKKIYDLESEVKAVFDEPLLDLWRRLQTSDHFYYMCTKWANDGDVHAYFSPYESPFEAYRHYSIALADFQAKLSNFKNKQVTKK